MRHLIYLIISFIVFLTSCALQPTISKFIVAERYLGASTVKLDASSLRESMLFMNPMFNDSFTNDMLKTIWADEVLVRQLKNYSDVQPHSDNLSIAMRILAKKGNTVTTLDVSTFEALYALSKLPVAIWIIVAHITNDNRELLNKKNINISVILDEPVLLDICELHLLTGIERDISQYGLVTHDNRLFYGKFEDRVNGTVAIAKYNQEDYYLKIIDCIVISQLPRAELKEYFDEWYEFLPCNYRKPVVLSSN